MKKINYEELMFAAGTALWSGDYGCRKQSSKKYILENLSSAPDVSFSFLKERWKCDIHEEWGAFLAFRFLSAIYEAQSNFLDYADITEIFSLDLYNSKGKVWTQQRIRSSLMTIFKVTNVNGRAVSLELKNPII